MKCSREFTHWFAAAALVLSLAVDAHAQQLGNFYVLAIGIDKYQSPSIADLNGCANDARAIADLFGSQSIYQPRVLLNEQATTVNISKALWALTDWVGERGNVVVFMSGHGGRERGGWFFVSQDFDPRDPQMARATRVDYPRITLPLRVMIEQKHCHVILILDACHAGEMRDSCEFDFRKYRQPQQGGLILFASCAGNETSKAGATNSVFTSALLDGLRGQADLNGDRRVAINELKRYLAVEMRHRVREGAKVPGIAWDEQDFLADWSLSVPDSLGLARVTGPGAAASNWDLPSNLEMFQLQPVVDTTTSLVGTWRMERKILRRPPHLRLDGTFAPAEYLSGADGKPLLEQVALAFAADGTYVAMHHPPFGRPQATTGHYDFQPGKHLTLAYDNGEDSVGVKVLEGDRLVLEMENNRYRFSESEQFLAARNPASSTVTQYELQRERPATAEATTVRR